MVRDLPMPPTLEIVKEHDFSLNLREPPERHSQPFLKFCMLRVLFRRPTPGRRSLGYGIRIPKDLATHQVAGSVPYNRHEPTSESVGGPAIIEPFKRDYDPLLCSVLSIVMAPRNRKADGIGRTHISVHESPEGLAITGLGPPDQILVRGTLLFTHRHRYRPPC
jgi:hypothetical protein